MTWKARRAGSIAQSRLCARQRVRARALRLAAELVRIVDHERGRTRSVGREGLDPSTARRLADVSARFLVQASYLGSRVPCRDS